MQLYILRHAIAVERGTAGYARDSERPLTDKGASKMRRIARGMQSLGLSFELVISSPYTRARQTAEILVDVYDMKDRLVFSGHLAAEASARDIVEEIDARYSRHRSLVLVGHEPYLSGLISTLVSGDDGLSITLKKGGLCLLDIGTLRYGRCATLEWLLTPRQLVRFE